MFVSVQNELPNYSLKSNKLDGSFFFYPRMNVSSFSLLVLLLSYVNLFKELFLYSLPVSLFNLSFCLRFRSLDTNPRHDITEASFVLFIWLIELLLESGCKGIAFSDTSQMFRGKSL